ncbi:hypothetical protein [Nocardioides caricicola]|uniref:DUF1648 domain-containing protein n=1 Tax=Nocardioides caricicola TaxID=634770 RepID=A0ABW0MXT7_9ACTN
MSERRVVQLLFLVGLGLLAVGAAVFFWQFPHTPDTWFGYRSDGSSDADWHMGWPGTEGDLRLSLAGAALAGAGFLVILVPIIAWAVRLGLRLAEADRG